MLLTAYTTKLTLARTILTPLIICCQEQQEAFRRAIDKCVLIETLVQGMNQYLSDAAIQEGACGRLWYLSIVGDDKKRVEIANLGGIEALLKAMKEHAAEANVQAQACGALRSLAFNDDNMVKIAALQGIEAILKAMKEHAAEAKVQEPACGALCRLATKAEENRAKIVNLGGIQAILKAMKEAEAEAKVERQAVQERACAALCSLVGIYIGRCDGCKISPILGLRWRCRVCPDFDLCGRCHTLFKEGKGVLHDSAHSFQSHGAPPEGIRQAQERIKREGGEEAVRRVISHKANDNTKTYGEKLLDQMALMDQLAQC